MQSFVQVMDQFEKAVGDSARESIQGIEHIFALAQTRAGWDVAIKALATVYVIAEQRRRGLEAELLRKE